MHDERHRRPRQPKAQRRSARGVASTVLAVTGILAMTGCGSSVATKPSGKITVPVGSSATSPSARATAVSTSAAPGLPLTTIPLTFTAPDGTTISASLQLSKLVPASDLADLTATWGKAGSATAPPCTADSTRDGISVGTLSFTNETPTFTPSLEISMQALGDAAANVVLSFGAGYTGGAQCVDVNALSGRGGVMQPALNPNFTNSTWGPVPVEFVLHGVFSPDQPQGNQALISSYEPILNAFPGSPTGGQEDRITTTSEDVSLFGPSGATLLLGQLK